MNIQLSLIEKWFRLTKNFTKSEDYRELTPYWYARLVLFDGTKRSKSFWEDMADINGNIEWCYWMSFKKFTTNTITLGYPKANDSERILRFEHKGIEIKTGNADWGAEPNKRYFVIMHGLLTTKFN